MKWLHLLGWEAAGNGAGVFFLGGGGRGFQGRDFKSWAWSEPRDWWDFVLRDWWVLVRGFFFFIQKWVLTVYPTGINKETLEAKRAHSALLLRDVSPHNTSVAAGHFLLGALIWTGTWHSLSQWACRGSPHHCQMLCTGTAPTSLYSSFLSQSTLGEGGRHICPKTREKQQKKTFKLPIITGSRTKAYFGDRSDRRLSTPVPPSEMVTQSVGPHCHTDLEPGDKDTTWLSSSGTVLPHRLLVGTFPGRCTVMTAFSQWSGS